MGGYRDDAWFKLPMENVGENGQYGEPSLTEANNSAFNYPYNRNRFMEAVSALEGTDQAYPIRRGYIRGLGAPGAGINLFKNKCQFQYNPQEIVQTVQMRQDVYLALLQHPEQYGQPVGGAANFDFDLIFDRQSELFSRKINGYDVEGNNGRQAIDVTANLRKPNYKTDPVDIGVLSDLNLFYSIIGQGFSSDLLNEQAKLISRQTSGKKPKDQVTEEEARKFIESNYGNSAFLIPMPVRVLFSSLFMVDGFVTGTRVDFLKFNSNMVPVQIRIGVSMQAMYIGFAKAKTFLTEQLDAAQDAIDDETEAQKKTSKELTTYAQQNLRSISYGWSAITDWDTAVSTGGSENTANYSVQQLTVEKESQDPGVVLAIGFQGFDEDKFNTLSQDQQAFVTVNWNWMAYGPYASEAAAVLELIRLAAAGFNENAILNSDLGIATGVKRVADYSGVVSSNAPSPETKEGPWYQTRYKATAPDMYNKSSNGLPNESIYYDYYYIVHYYSEVKVGNGTLTLVANSPNDQSSWKILRGDQKPAGVINTGVNELRVA